MQTENVHLVAFALCEGAVLKSINLSRSNGRLTAVFEVASPSIETISASFYDSTATVNLASYRSHLDDLKDRLRDAMSQTPTQDPTRRLDHETHRQTRARAHQVQR